MTKISFAVLLLPVLAFVALLLVGFILVVVGLFRRGGSGRQMSGEEVLLIQEMHQGFQRMEQRVDALETILSE
ncbi:MAG TPA: envelope stress response membrane protein PspB, partial [bacterium]|nr:envelope stress response membrane protein PspB [bacterium]